MAQHVPCKNKKINTEHFMNHCHCEVIDFYRLILDVSWTP